MLDRQGLFSLQSRPQWCATGGKTPLQAVRNAVRKGYDSLKRFPENSLSAPRSCVPVTLTVPTSVVTDRSAVAEPTDEVAAAKS